jgi:hypothetical protein
MGSIRGLRPLMELSFINAYLSSKPFGLFTDSFTAGFGSVLFSDHKKGRLND